jgi:hypothetical protein
MTVDPTPNRIDLNDYLFDEEKRFVVGDFREYLVRKRFNFIATLNSFPDISDLYFAADENWIEAIRGLQTVTKGEWIAPTQLTIFCFRELRIAAELLFSCCTTPGYTHLRTAMEAFTHAQKILREPATGKVWFSRDEDPAEYNKHFKGNVKINLFPEGAGFAHLHEIWKMLCDAGPHSTVTSLGISSSTADSGTQRFWMLDFFETDRKELSGNLLLLIMCSLDMFKHTYNMFHDRLTLHPQLLPRLKAHLTSFYQLQAKYVPRQSQTP